MALTSRSAVIEALASGRFDDLLGTKESSWLDFKGSPYPLDSPKGKFELCKDVAAFANAQGGLLICGVGEENKSHEAVTIASKLQPFPQNRADVGRYIDILNEHLRPRVSVDHHWFPDPPDGIDGYLVIDVEPVPEPERYVIVRRILNEKAQLGEGLMIPIRHGDRTIYLPSEDAYRLINDGLRAREAPATEAHDGLNAEAEDSVQALTRLQDWDEIPVLFWQTIPSAPGGMLTNLYSDDGIRGQLRNQNVLRSNGFNFRDHYGRLQTLNGSLFLGSSRCAFLLRPDGLMTAGAVATPEMLCWAMDARGRPQRINVYVLTELTLEYFRLADDLVIPRTAVDWRHRVIARRFQGEQPRTLGPGSVAPDKGLSDAVPASADSWDQSWRAVRDPERDAFEALVRIYALFGLDVTSNPDVEDDRVPMQRIQEG